VGSLSKLLTISSDSSLLEALLILQRKGQKVAFISSELKKKQKGNKYYSVSELVVGSDSEK
jgi:hypothetical protein